MVTVAIRLKKLALACVALVTLCAIASTGFSNYFQSANAKRALAFNPLNVEASTGVLIAQLGREDDQTPLADLEDQARRAIRYAPIHAPLRSLHGETLMRQGNEAAANEVFNVALGLSQTEATALQQTLRTAVADGNAEAAWAKLDILFRRWPGQFGSFAPFIPYLLSLPEGYEIALAALREVPPWRGRVLAYLNRDQGTVALAYRLQLDLNGNTAETNSDEIAGTVSHLLKYKQYDLAHRLFLLTLSDVDRENYGYVFNSSFDLAPKGRPFGWSIRDLPGVNVARVTRKTSQGTGSALTIQFQGKPVKQISVRQRLYLPAGKYQLTVDLDGDGLKAPKGLYFEITCLDPKRTITRLDVPTGSYRDRVLQSSFLLPDSSCKLLQLGMGTDLIAESFRYRYSGKLIIRDISIRKTTS